jgi:phosphatidylinositol glycan class B
MNQKLINILEWLARRRDTLSCHPSDALATQGRLSLYLSQSSPSSLGSFVSVLCHKPPSDTKILWSTAARAFVVWVGTALTMASLSGMTMNRSLAANPPHWIDALRSRLAPHPLLCCIIAALVPRLLVALCMRTYYAPDEVFQYIEQAHRLVYHQGFVPWEFQVGLRSWLIPLVLALPMEIARWITPAPLLGLVLIRVLCAIASLSIVWCAARWGQLFYDIRGAWIAGMLTAIWPDLWLMAPHPLEEALAAYTMVPALHLAILNRRSPSLRPVIASGFLLGASFVLREQLAPAIAIIGIYLCGRAVKNWVFALGTALLPVIAVGVLDWLSWGEMFRSLWANPYLNLVVGIAGSYFDSSPPVYYLLNLLYLWLWGTIAMVSLTWRGARKLPIAGLAALVIIVEHSVLAHKELRFIFPAIALLVPLAGVGLAHVWQPGAIRRNGLILALLLTGPYMSPAFFMMLRWQESASALYTKLAAHNPCVVAIESWDRGFWPIMPVFKETRFTDATGADYADAIVARSGSIGIPTSFTLGACAPESWMPFKGSQPSTCFWTRPSSFCQPRRAPPFTLVYPPAAHAFVIRDRLVPAP